MNQFVPTEANGSWLFDSIGMDCLMLLSSLVIAVKVFLSVSTQSMISLLFA